MAELFVGAGQQYQTILNAVNASANGDTITITDSATYTERLDNIQKNSLLIRSNADEPNNFPILKIYYNSNTLNFINDWVFKSVIMEPNADSRFTSNLKNITFIQCVIRNYDYFCACDCQSQSVKQFLSCLFYNFSNYVFNATQNFGDGALAIKNCTFHNCANIFKNDFYNEPNAASPKINNCVFTACPGIASEVNDVPQHQPSRRHNILQQFKNCTFTNDPQTVNAQLGANCNINISESVIYAQSARILPGDFKISNNPAVYNTGSDALGHSPDIGGSARTSPYDRGAWEHAGGTPPPTSTKIILPYINYQGAF